MANRLSMATILPFRRCTVPGIPAGKSPGCWGSTAGRSGTRVYVRVAQNIRRRGRARRAECLDSQAATDRPGITGPRDPADGQGRVDRNPTIGTARRPLAGEGPRPDGDRRACRQESREAAALVSRQCRVSYMLRRSPCRRPTATRPPAPNLPRRIREPGGHVSSCTRTTAFVHVAVPDHWSSSYRCASSATSCADNAPR